jgi:hypothetical protein
MNFSYMIYQVERQPSIMEQREADARAGELAATFAKAGHAVKAGMTRLAGGRPGVPGDSLIPVASSRC